MVKNPPSNAGDAGLILGRGTEIPHATGQLSQRAATIQTIEAVSAAACAPQLEKSTYLNNKEPVRSNEDPVQPKKKDLVRGLRQSSP